MRVQDMDELMGTHARLAILLTLADLEPWTFTALKNETGLADGNLHVQARKLVAAGYLEAEKVRQGNRLVTAFRLSTLGRDRLWAYGGHIGKVLGLKPGRSRSFPVGRTPSGPRKNRSIEDDSKVW